MSLLDTYNKLKTSIVGTKTSGIDAKLDTAVRDIVAYKSNSGRNGYIDLVKSLISKGGTMDIGTNIFQQGTTPATFGQGGRLQRYGSYAAIVSHISYCQRALDVLVDNILAPDDITKTVLEVNAKSYIEGADNASANVKDVQEIIRKMKLEEKLDLIVKSTLQNGDFFCEIADAKTALTSRSAFLTEVERIRPTPGSQDVLTEKLDDKKDIKIIMDFSALDDVIINKKDGKGKPGPDVISDLDDKKKREKMKPEDLHFLFYDPKRVVKLQSDMFPICFGYLIFPATLLSPQLMLQNQTVNSICQSILKSVEKKIPGIDDQSINTKDLQDIVRSMIKETDHTKAMNIRYVPPDRVQHFQRSSTKYYPYGESIFDNSQFQAKVLIAMQTALTILRLNRSIEKRKITVEVGLPRDATKAIEKLKEEFKRRKISLDSFGSVDTIPSQITSFEDVFIPQKDGKSFVDISNMNEGMADTRSKVEELKFVRDSIVAGLGVPPSFIGLEENVQAKATLSEENVLFARAIVNHQKYLTHQIQELIVKIYSILDPEKALTILNDITVAFPPPKSLQFERESAYLSNLANLVETLERIGVPRDWSKKKYLTSINWTEVEQHEINSKLDKTLKTDPTADQGEAGLGLGGLGGGLMGGLGGGMGGGVPPAAGGF
jgi:hypothetical protein